MLFFLEIHPVYDHTKIIGNERMDGFCLDTRRFSLPLAREKIHGALVEILDAGERSSMESHLIYARKRVAVCICRSICTE
jgi:hypothetical protein